jgi:Protein of unknown function (DUF2939)
MRRTVTKAMLGALALALLYLAWPLFSAWQLRQAVKTRDLAALETRVDWPVLRANLRPKVMEAVRENAEATTGLTGILKRAVGEKLADKGIDWIVTPKNLSRILAGREFYAKRLQKNPPDAPQQPRPGTKAAEANDPGADLEDPDDPMPPRRIRWAFFESPTRFRIEASHPRIPGARLVSILGQQGFGWKLIDVSLVEHATR